MAVKYREHACAIYTVDAFGNGVFRDSGEFNVTTKSKREYWRDTLLPEVSANSSVIIRSCLIQLSA